MGGIKRIQRYHIQDSRDMTSLTNVRSLDVYPRYNSREGNAEFNTVTGEVTGILSSYYNGSGSHDIDGSKCRIVLMDIYHGNVSITHGDANMRASGYVYFMFDYPIDVNNSIIRLSSTDIKNAGASEVSYNTPIYKLYPYGILFKSEVDVNTGSYRSIADDCLIGFFLEIIELA